MFSIKLRVWVHVVRLEQRYILTRITANILFHLMYDIVNTYYIIKIMSQTTQVHNLKTFL